MLKTARVLIFATLLYNIAEGIVAIWAGIGSRSLSLMAFGADSYLEVAAGAVVLWRLSISDSERGEKYERRAIRFIGWTFLLLALAVLAESANAFLGGRGAQESTVGIILAAASVTIMPIVALLKLRTAARGQMFALAAEAKETLACSFLSITLLLGLVANALFGWWWLDTTTALLLTPWLIKEGFEDIRGEEECETKRLCFCRSCLYGLRECKASCCSVEKEATD